MSKRPSTEDNKVCKMRAAELRDEILFEQPESTHLGDCPICLLQLSLDQKNLTMMEDLFWLFLFSNTLLQSHA
jgi:hypothetical protein